MSNSDPTGRLTDDIVSGTDTPSVPSSDIDAERMVIGYMLTNPAYITEYSQLLKAEDFYRPRHAEVYNALVAAHELGHPTEPVAFAAYLADRGDLQKLGGATFLSDCMGLVPTNAGNPHFYAKRITELADRRDIEAKGIRLVQAARTPGHTSESLLALVQSLSAQVRRDREELGLVSLGTITGTALEDIRRRRSRTPGISTGFKDLDRLMGGLRGKQLITIGGSTGMGKSIALVNIARHATIRSNLVAGFFSFEMAYGEIFDRILSAEAQIDHIKIRNGELDDSDWQRVDNRLGALARAKLFLSEKPVMTVREIQTACERLRDRHGLDIVFVDHMHLVDPSNPRITDPRQRLSDVSRGLKQLAMALDVPVVAAAQLNRNPNSRLDKLPQMSDLRESSSIEQDSDAVILLHREEYYNPATERLGEADLILAKNRSGPTGVVTVAAQMYYSRFVDLALPD